ncbi:hypothetical protein [Brevibacillus sp. WF146]|uniref:hypothetical protein n=1 Tax=Brevibacillus sp. WF146 TaxID=319501 RepID=UPI0039B58496
MAHSQAGKPARIIAKMNALTDKEIIEALYKASCAGVKIDLIVRGICCLRPGIEGVSENIRVISIVGRFLEHSRIYCFHNGGEADVFLSSADWMTRSMIARVEILFPVLQEDLKERILHILDIMLRDDAKARVLQPDGQYRPVAAQGPHPLNSQHYFWEEAFQAVRSRGADPAALRLKPITTAPER